MNVTLCVPKLENTTCVSPEPCFDFSGNTNTTTGCISILNTSKDAITTTVVPSSLLSDENLNAGLVAFFYFILTCIFLGLVYGIASTIQKHYRRRLWNKRAGQNVAENILCNDSEDIELSQITHEAPTCGYSLSDDDSEDIIYTPTAVIINTEHNSINI